MATVGNLIIQLQLDGTGIREGLVKQERLIQEFGRDLSSTILPEGAMVNAGQKAAAALISGLTNARIQKERSLDALFAAKKINEAEWRAQGIEAGLAFNKGLTEGEARLTTRYNISNDTRAVLQREIDTAAIVASNRAIERKRADDARLLQMQEQHERSMVVAHQRALEEQARMDQRAANEQMARDREAARQAAAWRQQVIKSAVDPRLTDFSSPAVAAANQLIKSAQATRDAALRQNKFDIASGGIDPKRSAAAAEAAAVAAYGAFNKTLVDGLEQVSKLPGFNQHIHDSIVDNMVTTGRQAANAFGEQLKQGVAKAGDEGAREFVRRATQANRMAAVGRTMLLAITAPIVAAGVASVRVTKNFEDAMLLLQSRSHATQAELDTLAQEAKRVGAETIFTNAQVAEAQAGLATRGGMSVIEIMRATGPVVQLAESQMIDLATAVETTVSVMREFGLQAQDTARITDVLAKAAALSGRNVDDFQTALSYVGPLAHAAGMSLEETVAALSILLRVEKNASKAGTDLRGMLEGLLNPTRRQSEFLLKNADVLDKNNKTMRPFVTVLAQLQKAAVGTGQSLAQFGQRAGTGAEILLNAGAPALQEYTNQLQKASGTVAEQAKVRMSGLTGAFSELSGAVENLGQALADSGIVGVLSSIVHGVTAFVRAFSEAPKPLLTTITVVAGFLAVIGPLVYTVAKIAVAINTFRASVAFAQLAVEAGSTSMATMALAGSSLAGVFAVGGVLAVGMLAIAALFYFTGRAARDAKRDMDEYQKTLGTIQGSDAASLEVGAQRAILQNQQRQKATLQARLDQTPSAKLGDIFKSDTDVQARLASRAQLESQIKTLDEGISKTSARVDAAHEVWMRFVDAENRAALAGDQVKKSLQGIVTGGDTFPGGGTGGDPAKKFIQNMADQANAAVELFQATTAAGEDTTRPIELMRKALGNVNATLATMPDKFGKNAAEATILWRAAEHVRTTIASIDTVRIEALSDATRRAVDQWNLLKEQQQATTEAGSRFGFDPAIISSQDLARSMTELQDKATKLNAELLLVKDPFTTGADNAAKLTRQILNAKKAITEVRQEQQRTDFVEGLRANPMTSVPQSRVIAPQVALQIGNLVGPGVRSTFIDVSNAVDKAALEAQEFADTVGDAIPGLRGFAQQITVTLRALSSLVYAAANPKQAFKNIIVRNDTGGVDIGKSAAGMVNAVGLVVGAVQTVSGFIGALTADQRAARELARRNLEELQRMRASIELQGRGVSVQVTAKNVVAAGLAGGSRDQDRLLAFIRSLQASGLSLDAITEIARGFGIELRNAKGEIQTSAFGPFFDALVLATQNVGKFADTLQDQQQKQSLHDNVFDIPQTPTRTIQNAIALFQKMDPVLGKLFDGLDATTKEGREKIKEVLKNIVTMLETTGLTAEQLGNFDTKDDFIAVLLELEGGFDDLADATNKVTDAMTNVPNWFKSAFRIFQATPTTGGLAGLVPQAPHPVPQPFEPATPASPVTHNDDHSVTFTGPIYITPGQGETTQQAFDTTIGRGRRLARAAGDSTDNWPKYVGR